MIRLFLNAVLLLSFMFLSCGNNKKEIHNKPEQTERTILFSGYEWTVAGSGLSRINPGQNYFSCSEENVWVDAKGYLHLKITKKNDKWFCSNVKLKETHGYGRYVFHVCSHVDDLDKNVVGGLFTYLDDFNEIDIEFSRWGEDTDTNSQFTIQPAHKKGNIFRYSMDLPHKISTHIIDWQKDRIDFASYKGYHHMKPAINKIISEWSYTGDDIPCENEEKVMINLWLFKGMPPSDGKESEMIIKSFFIE